jgi:hypothetical protein
MRSGAGQEQARRDAAKHGKNSVVVNATNKLGQSQTSELIFNPTGYHNNVMQSTTLTA